MEAYYYLENETLRNNLRATCNSLLNLIDFKQLFFDSNRENYA